MPGGRDVCRRVVGERLLGVLRLMEKPGEMIEVVSPPRSPGMALKLPVLALRRGRRSWNGTFGRSGFGRLHRAQYIPPAIASPGLPSRCSAGSRSIASGDAANGTRAGGLRVYARHANRRRQPRQRAIGSLTSPPHSRFTSGSRARRKFAVAVAVPGTAKWYVCVINTDYLNVLPQSARRARHQAKAASRVTPRPAPRSPPTRRAGAAPSRRRRPPPTSA